MMKLTVLYNHPTDEAAFEKYYKAIHLPLAEKIPDVGHSEFTKFLPWADGSQPVFYRMAELYFSSEEILMQALTSAEGQAAAADIPKFATGGFHFLIGKV
ncbi:MAG: EthD family reductase [Ferruginibacter sp.]